MNDNDSFPIWKPQNGTISKFSQPFQIRYKALRYSSSGFIKRKEVRDLILKKCGYKCEKCGSEENLQVDHIKSVYLAALGKFNINELNTYNNLTVLCKTCNSKKSPNL